MMRSGRIAHDGDPVLAWMLGNVVGHYDAKENVYPRKERPENKIDGAIALIMALGRHTVVKDEPSLDGFIIIIMILSADQLSAHGVLGCPPWADVVQGFAVATLAAIDAATSLAFAKAASRSAISYRRAK